MLVTAIIYFFILLLNISLVFFSKKSRLVCAITVSFIVIGTAENIDNPDYYNYFSWYEGMWHPETVDEGYLFITKVFSDIGVSYSGFLAVVQLFSMGVYLGILKKYTQEYHLFLALYLLYQIFLDYVQIRNTIAMSLLVLALYLLSYDKKIMSLLLILASTSIHKSMILFLPLPFLVNWKNSIKFVKVYTILILIFCGVIFLNGNNVPFLELLSGIPFLAHKFEKYFSTKTRFGFLLPFVVQVINLLFTVSIVYSLNRYKNDGCKIENKEPEESFVNVAQWFVLYSSFAFPLVMLHEEFIRYFRNCNIIVFLLASILFSKSKQYKVSKMKFPGRVVAEREITLFILIFGFLVWLIVYSPNHVISTFFTNNRIFAGYE